MKWVEPGCPESRYRGADWGQGPPCRDHLCDVVWTNTRYAVGAFGDARGRSLGSVSNQGVTVERFGGIAPGFRVLPLLLVCCLCPHYNKVRLSSRPSGVLSPSMKLRMGGGGPQSRVGVTQSGLGSLSHTRRCRAPLDLSLRDVGRVKGPSAGVMWEWASDRGDGSGPPPCTCEISRQGSRPTWAPVKPYTELALTFSASCRPSSTWRRRGSFSFASSALALRGGGWLVRGRRSGCQREADRGPMHPPTSCGH